MAIFDQRGQRVNYQYNAAGDINFGDVKDQKGAIIEMEKLYAELEQAVRSGILNEDAFIDIEYRLKQAILQAKKAKPDKKTILDHLNEAKSIIEGVTAAAGLVTALTQAATMIQKVF